MKKIGIFLLIVFSICLFSYSTYATTDSDNYKYVPKVITVGEKDKMVFDAELARVARKMSTDTYKLRYDSNAQDIAKTFVSEGFTDIQQSHYFDDYFMGSFSNNFLVGAKTFKINGKEKHIIAVAFRGTTIDGFDYGDLFTDISVIGTNGFHTGFYMAANQAFNTLNDMKFPSLKNDDGSSMSFSDVLAKSGLVGGDYYILVTGHSLGGAVANIFTGELLSQISKSNVMCYTFASPKVCTSETATAHNAYNIFNIINNNDIVPDVGYNIFVGTRMGNDFRVTVSDSEESAHDLTVTYDKALDKVISGIDSYYPYIHRIRYKETKNDVTTEKDEIHIHSDCTLEQRKGLNFMPVSDVILYGDMTLYKSDLNIKNLSLNNSALNIGDNSVSINDLNISSGTITFNNPSTLECNNFSNIGTSQLSNANLTIKGTAKLGGIIHATINAYGNINGSSGTVDNLNICGTTAQNINGSFNVGNLVFNNPKGVTLSNTIGVSGSVENTATKIKNSKNICLVNGAKISGNYFLGDITFQSAKLTVYAEIDGNLFLSSGASEIAGLKVNKFIQQTSGSLMVNGTVNAESDVYLYNLTQNNGTFNVKGNINSGGSGSNSKVSFNLLNFNGKLPQSVNREIHVNNFYYNNTNREKVTLNYPMYVYGSLSLKSSLFNNDTNVYLCGSFANKDKYVGNLTLNNFSSEMPKVYEGNLIMNNFNSALSETYTGNISAKGTNIISDVKKVNGDINISSGATTFKDATALNIDGTLSNSGTIKLNNCQGKIDHLTTSGTVNYDDSTIQLGTISQGSGNINMTNTNVKVTGAVTATKLTLDKNSQLNVLGDISVKGTLSGDGIINLYGNYNGTGTCSVSSLNLCGKFSQTVGGGFAANKITANEKTKITFTNLTADTITVKGNATATFDGAATIGDLYLEKDSTVAINKAIVINNGYHDNGATISGIDNTSLNKILSDTTFTEDTIYTNDMVLSANITIDGCTVTMSKKLNTTRGNITIINGGKLIVNKEATLNCGTISVTDKSSLVCNGKSTFASGTINISNESSLILKGLPTFNGVSSIAIDESSAMECRRLMWAPSLTNLTVNGSLLLKFGAYLPKTTVSGSGTVDLYGDFNVSSGRVNKIGNFNILGKLPQTITGANIKFYNLNIDNPTVTTFSSKVFYSGDYVVNKGTVNGTVTYEEEVAE